MTARSRTRRILQAALAGSVAAQVGASLAGVRWLRVATRPLMMLLLAAWAGSAPALRHGLPPLLAGLVLSAAGDTALAFDSRTAFLAGVAFFLGTQLCYIAGCLRFGCRAGLSSRPAVPVALGATWLGLVLALWRRWGSLRWPVAGYGLALFGMAALSLGVGPELFVGAVLFVLSDVANGFQAADVRFPGQDVVIGVCYLVGQVVIARSWCRSCRLRPGAPARAC